MGRITLKDNIYYLGAIDWDRRLFDELIPLPDGTSYNSYLIKGSEKVALIDTVDYSMHDVLVNNLKDLGIKKIDYIITNHAEQDHSGSLPVIIDMYPPEKLVILPYVSMHNSTKQMVDYFVKSLIERKVSVKQFNLTGSDIGKLAISLVDASTIVIGTPTVLAGPHPTVVYGTYLVKALNPKLRFAGVLGSYGWGGRTVEYITNLIS